MDVEYQTLECLADELNPAIKAAQADGWMVHTFQAISVRGHTGTDTVRFYVLLQRTPIPTEEPEPEEGGIAMRG